VTDLRITHIGGPTVLIQFGGWRLLTDPTFDPPGQKYNFGWGTGSVKLAGPAVAASELGPIDAVLLTHDHHDDNLDPAGVHYSYQQTPSSRPSLARIDWAVLRAGLSPGPRQCSRRRGGHRSRSPPRRVVTARR